MSGVRSGRLLAVCAVFAALAVPLAYAFWLRSTNSFIGGLTMIGSSDGRPREIATGWLFAILGLMSALVYAVPAGLALLILRRLSNRARNVVMLIILPVALGVVWYRLTRRG
jgi:phosphotransferase system  glucose/maltose/N-acetylglucosamine-specific IIC component